MLPVDPQPDGPAALAEHVVGVSVVQRHPALGHDGRAQHPLERHAPTPQSDHPVRRVRQHCGLGAHREQRLQHLGRLGRQGVHDLRTEGVRMVELHHPGTAPLPVRRGTRIAVDDHDGVPAAGEGEREEETGRSGSDDGNAHEAILPQPAAGAIRETPISTLRRARG